MARLVGIGVGPGDPGMLTLRALAKLRSAETILAPAISASLAGRAELVVTAADPSLVVERIVFDMAPDAAAAAARERSAAAAAQALVPRMAPQGSSAFVTLGDVSLYSTFYPLAQAVRRLAPDVQIEMVPGISAFSYLAARTAMDLLDKSERLHVVAVLGEGDLSRLEVLLADGDATLVLYKCGRRFGRVRELLRMAGRLGGALVGEQLGTPSEMIVEAGSVAADELGYFATIIVPSGNRGAQRL